MLSPPSHRPAPPLAAWSLLLLCTACVNEAWRTPYSTTPRGMELRGQAMTRDKARALLADLPEADRQALDQLMFLADLPMASGNESDPVRLFHRVKRELAEPLVVSAADVDTVVRHMAGVLETRDLPEGSPNSDPGYEVVKRMLAPAEGVFPSPGVCLDRIAEWPDDVALAFLVQEYFADDHYYPSKVRSSIVDLLASGDRGIRPLPVMEHALQSAYPSSYDATWLTLTRWGRRELGSDYSDWYREVRGKPWWVEEPFNW